MQAFAHRFLALVALLVGVESQALTLGRVQGAALIGRGLDVSIQVQLDPGQSISSPCFEADVFHGDTRQDPARVKVQLEPSQASQNVRLRIQSENPVDEPLVTIYLRAGCAQMISRRYVLLADIVSEQAAPVAPRVGSVPLVTPQASGAAPAATASARPGNASTGSAATAGSVASPTLAPAVQPAAKPRAAVAEPAQQGAAAPARPKPAKVAAAPKAAVPKAAAAATSRPVPEAAVPPQPGGQARLQLDPLELLSDRVSTLESTTGAGQSEAAARDAKRLETLETNIRTLLALAARNEASLLEMRARMRQSQEDRYGNPVVVTLAALLLASLLAIIYLLSRRLRQGANNSNWWDASDAAQVPVSPVATARVDSSPAPLPDAPASQPDSLPPREHVREHVIEQVTQGLGPRVVPKVDNQVDVSLVEMSESTFDRLMQSGAAHSALRKTREQEPQALAAFEPGAASSTTIGRSRINSEELFDTHQRAEFFVSLGQTDQAVEVLENRIAQDGESTPQAYLDLLRLFHSLGLKADYRQVRDDFSLLFNARVPDFVDFTREGRALEEFPGILDRIIAVWSSADVLATFESLLYREEPGAPEDLFDLAAFRDLLTLHAVAQVVRSGSNLASGAFSVPLPAIDSSQELDIDLSGPDSLDEGMDYQETKEAPAGAGVESLAPESGSTGNLIDFDLSESPLDKPDRGDR